MMAPDISPVPFAVSVRRLLAPALCSIAVGLLISLLPDLLLMAKGKQPEWIADSDELLYLSVAAQSYFEHPFYLADPILPGPSSVSMYPWIQFAPGILPAHFLRLGPLAIGFFWRAFAGASIGLGIFLVLWKIIQRPWIAAAGTTWMLSDAGVLTGQPFFQQIAAMRKLALVRGDYLIQGEPQIMRLWRIISPGLSLAYLLVFLFALLHARASSSRRSTIFAGAAFGILFYIYFYYWTAAALALLLCAVLDKARRRSSILIGIIGGIIGAPAIVSGFLLKHSTGRDWLQRGDMFVAIPHFSKQLWYIVPDCALVISLWWVLIRRRDLLPVWALAFSGMLLANHQIVTGMDIQNYHYLYVFGPVFSLLVIGAIGTAGRHFETQRPWLVRSCAAILCVVSVLSGMWLRAAEAVLTVVPLKLQSDLNQYREQRESAPSPRLAPNSVVAGNSAFLYLSPILEDQRPLTHYAVLFSPAVSNQEWDRRDALNAYVTGLTLEEFDVHQREFFQKLVYGPWVYDPAARASRIENREEEFRKISRDPIAALRELRVRYVALNVYERLPEAIAAQFDLVQEGPSWVIWELRQAGP